MTARSSGFTLIELLVVVAILGIIAAVGIVSYNGYVSSAKKKSAENVMQQISLGQTEYYSDNGMYYRKSLLLTSFCEFERLFVNFDDFLRFLATFCVV